MGAEIDRLDIQIEAEATKANQQLSNMAKYLESVAGSLMKINGSSGVVALSTISSNLAASATQLSQVKASDFKKISSGLTAFANVNSGGLWNTANAVKGLANNLSGIDGIHFDSSGLDGLVNALSKLGSKSSGLGTENLIKIKDDLAKFVQSMNDIGAVNFDISGMGMAGLIHSISSMGGEKVTQATKNLPALSVYLRKLVNEMNGIGKVSFDTTGLAELVKALSALGGKGATQAIKNLPSLSTELSKFMNVMSKVPEVSDRTIQMTVALSTLAAQGNKVGTAARSTANAFGVQGKSAQIATSRIQNLSSALVILQQAYRMISRAAKKLYSFTTSSMDFLETVNYFEVAMRKIGDSAADEWRENGYTSAEAYAESFSERAKQLTEKMTGYAVDENGNATYTNVKNLGMDPDAVLQYQATFAQISSSIGVAEESALNFSKALTMLGADWASLRNLSFEQGWEKFASALAGQSRAVRSLGIDITNATLQEYAYNYGLDQAISKMNQATKAQLRLLAILDQSKVAYGDLANTIQSPANQIRMLQQNVSNLGRVFGNLFLPILQKVLPYINGVTIAVQRLFTWIGSLIGIKFDSINSSMGGMSDEMYDLVDGSEDLTTGIGNADKAAKKLNKTLQGWHEINNISTKEDSGSDSGSVGYGGGSPILDDEITKALADYEKAWNDAFSRMENKAQTIADKLGKYLEPVKKIIQDFAIGDYFQAGKDTSALVVGIFNFIADAIKKVNWYKIGKNIGDFIAGIDWLKILKAVGRVFSNALNAAFELWVGALSAAPIETILATLLLLPNALKAIAASKIIKGIETLCSKFMGLGNHIKSFAKTVGEKGLVGGLQSLSTGLSNFQKGVIGVTAVLGEFVLVKEGIYDIVTGTENLELAIGKIVIAVGVAGAALTSVFGFPAGIIATAIAGVIGLIKGVADGLDEINTGRVISSLTQEVSGLSFTLSDLEKAFSTNVQSIVGNLTILDGKFDEFTSKKDTFEDLSKGITLVVDSMQYQTTITGEEMDKLSTNISNLKATWQDYINASFDFSIAQAQADMEYLRSQGELTNEIEQSYLKRIAQLTDEKNKTIENAGHISDSLNELTQQYIDGKISLEDYQTQYHSFMGEASDLGLTMNESTSAISETNKALKDLAGQLDLSQENITDYDSMNQRLADTVIAMGEAYRGASDAISQAEQETTEAMQKQTGVQLETSQAHLDMLKQQKQDLENATGDVADILQRNYVDKGKEVLENAMKEYEDMGWGEKVWYNLIGVDKQDYAKSQFQSYAENVILSDDGLVGQLNKELGLAEDQIWVDDFIQNFYDDIFNATEWYGDGNVGTTSISENIAELYNKELEKVPKQIDYSKLNTEETGKYITQGIVVGMTAEIGKIGADLAKSSAEMVDAINESYGIASPAKSMNDTGEYIVAGIVEGMGLYDFVGEMNKWWKANVEPWFSLERWTELGKNVKTGLINEWNSFVTFYRSSEIWDFIMESFSANTWTVYGSNMKDSLSAKWNEFTNEFRIDSIWEFIRGQFSKESWTFGGISEGLQESFEAAWNAVKNGWSGFADWLEKHMTFKIDTNTAYGKELSKLFGGATEVQMIKLPRYSTGGFPEDGLFMANHGELVGEFANGKTAVANNDQITAGIEEAAYRGVSRALAERGDSNVTFKVEGDPNGLFKVVKKQSSDYTKRTGRPAFG